MKTKNKKILLDTETTGIDLKKNDMWQIAGYVIIDDEIVQKFNIKFQPKEGTEFNQEALGITGMTEEDFKLFPENKKAMDDFLGVLNTYVDKYDKQDKFHLIAYNAHFDANFLRKWMGNYPGVYYGSYFWSNNIDIMTMVGEALSSIRHKMVNFKLQTVHRVLNVIGLINNNTDYSNTHDAYADIALEYEIYNLFCYKNICETLEKIKQLKKGK